MHAETRDKVYTNYRGRTLSCKDESHFHQTVPYLITFFKRISVAHSPWNTFRSVEHLRYTVTVLLIIAFYRSV